MWEASYAFGFVFKSKKPHISCKSFPTPYPFYLSRHHLKLTEVENQELIRFIMTRTYQHIPHRALVIRR